VIIEFLRGRAGILTAFAGLHSAGTATYCTPISWAEVYAGLRPGEEPMTDRLLEGLGEVVLDARTGRQAGRYLARFAGSHGLKIADALVAAAAATTGLHLWTLNRRDYPMEDVHFFEPRLAR
jgi:predicted nucleic acid-binding protein